MIRIFSRILKGYHQSETQIPKLCHFVTSNRNLSSSIQVDDKKIKDGYVVCKMNNGSRYMFSLLY
jgi:hypothetical protein